MINRFFGAILHAEHGQHGGLSDLLVDTMGEVGRFLDEVLLHGILDTLKIVAFLFLTYLFMEFIEHRASDKARALMKKAGAAGPAIGGMFGAVPQCGFSSAGANLYTGRVITLGTLLAVFLSTSDEMLPILLAGEVDVTKALLIIVYKTAVGIFIGFLVDLTLRLLGRGKREIDIDEICDNDNCHCERGILRSALHHTLTVSLFVLIVTLLINALVFFIGEESISNIVVDLPVLGHFICSLIGLIPNCAASVALTRFATAGFITSGAMISGLLTGAGVGLLVLFRMNRRVRENLLIVGILVAVGVIFGVIADFIPALAL